MRLLWLVAGLLCTGVGGLGIIVPGLPTTVFFIGAAACFSKSSPRLERWVLELKGIGPLVADYRAGLGMPRRAKVFAIGAIVAACGLSAGLLVDSTVVRAVIVVAGLVGIAYIAFRVPTRERVLAERAASG